MPNITYKSCYYLFILLPTKGLLFYRYFKLSCNSTALSQSNCRNFSFSSINSRIPSEFSDFHVLKENFKTFFSITVRDIYIPFVINENSKVKVMYGVFLVYLPLQPSSNFSAH